MAHNASVSDFLQYVRRRRLKLVVYGLAIIALGMVVIALHPQSTDLNIWMGGLIFFGVGLSLSGSAVSYKLLREAQALVNSDGRTLELFTYLYRGGARSLRNDRVLATLDAIGSHERVPLIEFKAI